MGVNEMKNLRLMCLLTMGLLQASLSGAWNQPPDLVSNPLYDSGSFSGPVLRVNPLGNAISVWGTPSQSLPLFENTIQSAYYARGFGWFPSQIISSLELNEFGGPLYTAQGDPSIAFNSTGYAVAAWEGEHSTDNFAFTVIAARRDGTTGNWSPVEIIGDDTGDFFSSDVNVSMNEAGTTLAVWTSEDLNTFLDHTTVSFLPFGGSWTAPFYLAGGAGQPEGNSKPYGFINPSGNAVVTWIDRDVNDQTFWHVSAATYDVGTNTWSSPVFLDTAQFNPFQFTPRCGMDAAGNAVVVWTKDDGVASPAGTAKAAYFNGTAWEPAITLGPSDTASVNSAADVVVDLNGNATAVWTGPRLDTVVYASSRLSNGTWTDPQVISTPGINAIFNPFMSQEPLAVNTKGDVIATWRERVDNDIIKSGYKPFGQDWRAPETVFNSVENFTSQYNIGLASCGFAVDLWKQFGENDTIMATENENLLLVQNATAVQCQESFATQKRFFNILTWDSDPCALSFNLYCNGVLVANIPNTNTGVIRFVVPVQCKNPCNYTVTLVNTFGIEGASVPVVFN